MGLYTGTGLRLSAVTVWDIMGVRFGMATRTVPNIKTQLKMKKVKRCIQNIMDHEQLIEMNKKLINFVNNECLEHGLVKK